MGETDFVRLLACINRKFDLGAFLTKVVPQEEQEENEDDATRFSRGEGDEAEAETHEEHP